jgi:hypothetical protein
MLAMTKAILLLFYVTFPHSGGSTTQPGPQSVPGSRGTSSEVLSLNASTQFPWKSKKRENNMSSCQSYSSPNWPTKSCFQNFPAEEKEFPLQENSVLTILLANFGWKNFDSFCLDMWPLNQTGNLPVNHQGDIRKVPKTLMN